MLTKQDNRRGIILWEFGLPYLIAHGDNGYCVHLNRNTYKCTVREHRTVPCRVFDCRDNERCHVRVDYEKKVFNYEMEEIIEKDNSKIYFSCISKLI